MKISTQSFCYNCNQNYHSNNSVNFKNHPDFDRLENKGLPIMMSTYYRYDFQKITNIFRGLCMNRNTPIKLLIAGVADNQEPFSYLTMFRTINRDKPIDEVVDLHIIDLQSKPTSEKLFGDSLISRKPPVYIEYGYWYNQHYKRCRVDDDLFEYLLATYNNPEKSKWETRLQEQIKDYPENYFDVISANSVLHYIDWNERKPTYDNMCKKTAKDGYIFTCEDDTYAHNSTYNNMLQRQRCIGIYKKCEIT